MNKCPECNDKDFIGVYSNKYDWKIVKRFCLNCGYEEKI